MLMASMAESELAEDHSDTQASYSCKDIPILTGCQYVGVCVHASESMYRHCVCAGCQLLPTYICTQSTKEGQVVYPSITFFKNFVQGHISSKFNWAKPNSQVPKLDRAEFNWQVCVSLPSGKYAPS